MKVIIEGENISDIIFNVQFNKGCLSESSENLKKLPVSVKIELSGTAADSGKEYKMSIEGEIPNPYIFSQNGTDHCANMEIILKEVG